MEQRMPELLRQPVELSPEQAVEERIEAALNDPQLSDHDRELLERLRGDRAPMKQYPDIESFQEDCNNFHLFFTGGLGDFRRSISAFRRYAILFPEEEKELKTVYRSDDGFIDDECRHPEPWEQLFDAYQKMSLLVAETDEYVYRQDGGSGELSLDAWFLNR